jgi:hypothetical protein
MDLQQTKVALAAIIFSQYPTFPLTPFLHLWQNFSPANIHND